MKVYFDIITNHTADVIGYQEGARTAYVPKDRSRTGPPPGLHSTTGTTPAPTPSRRWTRTTSFPYTPELDPGEQNLKVPAG